MFVQKQFGQIFCAVGYFQRPRLQVEATGECCVDQHKFRLQTRFYGCADRRDDRWEF
jgi:hypothetical protein